MAKAVTIIRYGVALAKPEEVRGRERTHQLKTIQPGEKVDKKLFSDEEWKALVAAGAVVVDDKDYPPAPSPRATSHLMDETVVVSEEAAEE